MSNRKHMKKSEGMRKRMHARGGAHEKAGVHMRGKKPSAQEEQAHRRERVKKSIKIQDRKGKRKNA